MAAIRAASSASTVAFDSDTPILDAFKQAWIRHLNDNNLSHYIQLIEEITVDQDEYEIYREHAENFVDDYCDTMLNVADYDKIINEYGFRKFVKLMEESCVCNPYDELCSFNENKEHWAKMTLINVV